MIGGYQEHELQELHKWLHRILGATLEVTQQMGITPILIGGSAIGALYDGDILPWDDDIDLGLLRPDYERFIREAQHYFGDDYFVQSPLSERDMPYYFTKVRLRGSTFASSDDLKLNIEQGIYIDIFPLDYLPTNSVIERIHRRAVGICENLYRIAVRGDDGSFASWCYGVAGRLIPRRMLYRILSHVQSLWSDGREVNIVRMPRDHIAVESISPAQQVRFGEYMVAAPRELERYLRHHYPGLHRPTDSAEYENHRPESLSFPSNKI